VHLAVDGEAEKWEMSLTTFLAKSFSLELDSNIWPKDWLQQSLPHLAFNPAEL
jgi:hypothetical protein